MFVHLPPCTHALLATISEEATRLFYFCDPGEFHTQYLRSFPTSKENEQRKRI